MENSYVYSLLKLISTGFFLAMSPLLRGSTKTNYPENDPVDVEEFVKCSKKKLSKDEQIKFFDAFKAQLDNLDSKAKKLYKELLETNKKNEAIIHNLTLLKK